MGDWVDRFASALSALAAGSVEHRGKVVAAVLLATLVLGAGIPQLQYQTGINEWLPRDDEKVQAFDHLLEDLHGVSNLEFVYLELDRNETDVRNVTSEKAIRAQHDVYQYVADRVPDVRHVYGLPHWVMLVNYANHDNDPAHYRIPESSQGFQSAWETAWRTNRDTLTLSVNQNWTGAWIGIIFEAEPFSQDAQETGGEIREAMASYREDPNAPGDIWRDEHVRPTGLTAGTHHIDQSVRDDVETLAPVAFALIAAALLLAFRSAGAVVAALATLGASAAAVFGLMGWLGIEITLANVILLPLILGNGIDFTIHVLNRFQEERSRGRTQVEAFSGVGRRVGIPLALATATTIAGLLTTVVSSIPGMVQLGWLAAVAMLVTWTLALTFLPALASLLPQGEGRFRPMPRLGAWARKVADRRVAAAGLLLVVSGVLAFSATNQVYLLDMVDGNFPEDDPFLKSSTALREDIQASSVEWIILEGDVTDPEALEYVRSLEEEVYERDLVARKANVQSLVSLLGNYEMLENGTAGAAFPYVENTARDQGPRSQAPDSREEVESDVQAMYGSRAWAPTAKFLVSQEMDLTVLIVAPDAEADSYEEAESLWNQLTAVKEGASEDQPDDVEAHIYGFRTIPYHFVNWSQDSLRNIFFASLATAMTLVGVFTRRWRAVAAVGVPMAASALWWWGLLPVAGIYVGVFLLFPMIFITSIGSDYAAHLVWSLHEGEPFDQVFSSVGKAVAFSAVTDAAAFGVFSFMYLDSARTIMRGASLAILCVGAATLTLVPLVWGSPEGLGSPGEPGTSEKGAGPATSPAPDPEPGRVGVAEPRG
jgi:predicted RND superfamily exporter protein